VVVLAPISAQPVAGPANGLQLVVIGGGVRMPAIQAARAEAIEDKRPVSRAGSEVGENAFLPTPAPVAPVVPVYPRKQARH